VFDPTFSGFSGKFIIAFELTKEFTEGTEIGRMQLRCTRQAVTPTRKDYGSVRCLP